MKEKIIYIVSFLAAFCIVTFAIIELNNTYKNIFDFNFTKVEKKMELPEELKNTTAELEISYLKEYFQKEFKKELLDSIKANTYTKIDTIYQEILKDETLLDSIAVLKQKLNEVQSKVVQQQEEADAKPVTEQAEQEIIRDEEWAKSTAKLFESMDPEQAAKVLSTYSDNEARSIIYKMKNKKAAEILSILKPDFVNRITKPKL